MLCFLKNQVFKRCPSFLGGDFMNRYITNNTILYFSGWLTSVQTMLKAILYKEENILNSSIYVCIYKIKFKVWKQDRTDLIKIHFQPKKKKKPKQTWIDIL